MKKEYKTPYNYKFLKEIKTNKSLIGDFMSVYYNDIVLIYLRVSKLFILYFKST